MFNWIFNNNIDYNKRVYGLDLFRAIAIILVVLTHGNFMIEKLLPGFPYIQILDGVELFFVLSGFLIGTIILKMFEEGNEFGIRQAIWFWKRRWYRTVPNYMLILLANILLVYFISGDLSNFNYKFLLFIQNFSEPFTGFFWESWSLTIEEWFYLILPLVIIILSVLFKNILKKKHIFLIVAILFILIPTVYRMIIADQHQVDFFWWDVRFRKVVLTRLDTIMFGVLGAYIKYYYQDKWFKHKKILFLFGLIIIYVSLYLKGDPNDFFRKTFYFSTTSIGVLFLLPWADSIKSFKSKVGQFITHISLISYSMYLINLALVADLFRNYWIIENPWLSFIQYILYWLIVVIVSSLIFKYFEKPIMNLRDRRIFGIGKK